MELSVDVRIMYADPIATIPNRLTKYSSRPSGGTQSLTCFKLSPFQEVARTAASQIANFQDIPIARAP